LSKLYIVGTPIGNLGDISPRALSVLDNVDFIAAEDTRVSLKLLNHFNIKKPMLSYFQHNIRERGMQIIERILAGESCAIITDAGMPCISDPGEDLVNLCHENGIPIEIVPGPTAAISALAASGLPTGRFSFEGFLSVRKASRFAHLDSLVSDPRTLIFYEAPHKLRQTLTDMLKTFGDRRITLARELTKIHEEITRTTLSRAIEEYSTREPKGEYVLIVEGASEKSSKEEMSLENAAASALALCDEGLSLSEACKKVSAETNYKKGDIYRIALESSDKD